MRKEDKINEASIGLLKALGMGGDRKVMEREYMDLMRFTIMGQDAPFFSEGYLYEAVGKDDARSVLAYLRSLLEACGIPRDKQHELSCLADRTQSCEFCWGDGYQGDNEGDICTACNGDGWRIKNE